MKKNRLITGLTGLATIVAVSAPIVLSSCDHDNEKALNITFNKGAHVTSIEATGDVRTNKSFNIICTFERGWKQINDVTIKVGTTTLASGTDYVISSWNKITINPNVIKSTEVEVNVTSSATPKSWAFELDSSKKKANGWYAQPSESISKDDITITATYGDGSTKPVSFGTSDTDAKLIYNNEDYTPAFVLNGFTALETMIKKDKDTGKKLVTQLPLKIKNSDGKGTASEVTFPAYVGYKPADIELTAKTGLVKGDSVWLNKQTNTTTEAGFTCATYKVTGGTAGYDEESLKTGLLVSKEAGTIIVEATSAYDTTLKSDPQTYTFEEQ